MTHYMRHALDNLCFLLPRLVKHRHKQRITNALSVKFKEKRKKENIICLSKHHFFNLCRPYCFGGHHTITALCSQYDKIYCHVQMGNLVYSLELFGTSQDHQGELKPLSLSGRSRRGERKCPFYLYSAPVLMFISTVTADIIFLWLNHPPHPPTHPPRWGS